MGANHAKERVQRNYLNSKDSGGNEEGIIHHADRHPREEKPELNSDQVAVIQKTWKILQEDMAKVGVVLFLKLFETHPDIQDVFTPFRGMTAEEMRHSSSLRAHALRVMGAVEKVLARIDDPCKVEQLLHELGQRHVMYNARVDYIDLVGPQFISAIQPVLQEEWTPEAEQAWSDLFKIVSYHMKHAMVL